MFPDQLRSVFPSGTHILPRSNRLSGWGMCRYCLHPDRSYCPDKHRHLTSWELCFLDMYNKWDRLRQGYRADKHSLRPNRLGCRHIYKYNHRLIVRNKGRMQNQSTFGLAEWQRKQSQSCFRQRNIRMYPLLAKFVH